MNIGEAAGRTGLPRKTIRYYEEIGLVTPDRRDNGYRDYGEREVHELRFVGRARALGFGIEDCARLLGLYRDKNRASAEVRAAAQHHIDSIRTRIAELQAMEATLTRLVTACHGDARPDCPILDDLAGPAA